MINRHTLNSPILVITVIAEIVSVPIYVITVVLVLSSESLKGSFFKIYVASAIINIFVHFNRYIIVKFPLFTCGHGCFFSDLMMGKGYWFLQISLALHWYSMLVQVSLQCLIAMDRFIVIGLGDGLRMLWSKFYVVIIVLTYLIPWICSYPLLLEPARFNYSVEMDTFTVSSSVSLNPMYTTLLWTMLITTGLSFFFNLTTFLKFLTGSLKLSRSQRAIELKLFVNCMVQMLSEVSVLRILKYQDSVRAADPQEHDFSRVLMSICSDILLFFPPYVLIITCDSLRKKILFWKKVQTAQTSVDSHMYR